MQIVIDIPEDDYYDILQYAELKVNTEFENLMIVAIKNGTPLPKGHGRLVDADAIKNGKPHESVTEFADRCRECGREKVLDKIRAEIEQVKSIMNEEINDNNRKDLINFVNGLNQTLIIVERYKAESEG